MFTSILSMALIFSKATNDSIDNYGDKVIGIVERTSVPEELKLRFSTIRTHMDYIKRNKGVVMSVSCREELLFIKKTCLMVLEVDKGNKGCQEILGYVKILNGELMAKELHLD